MKLLVSLTGSLLLFYFSVAQSIELKELTGLVESGSKKLENQLPKKGFKKNFISDDESYASSFVKEYRSRPNDSILGIQMIHLINDDAIVYQTTSQHEDSILKRNMESSGFRFQDGGSEKQVVYQRQNLCIEHSVLKRDTVLFYEFRIQRKILPKKRDLVYAEDLFEVDAHEHLTEVFGKESVKEDVFYFTENDSTKCSVLYSGTNREAVFIWKDEANLRGLSFIVIGAVMNTRKNDKPSGHNTWPSRQSVYCGMSLKELQALNKEPIRFYNWQTESAGYTTLDNKGLIDFSRIGMVFNCLNCAFVKVANKEVVDSETALREDQKVFVTSLIFLPSKKSETHSTIR